MIGCGSECKTGRMLDKLTYMDGRALPYCIIENDEF